jgi:hypothetical protein
MFVTCLWGSEVTSLLRLNIAGVGSDQAKLLLFQGLFAKKRYYLALELYFPYQNGCYKAAPAFEG